MKMSELIVSKIIKANEAEKKRFERMYFKWVKNNGVEFDEEVFEGNL